MGTHIEVTKSGGSYIGCNIRRIIKRVQCMETHRVYYVWRHICRFQCLENHIEAKIFGSSYRWYNVW